MITEAAAKKGQIDKALAERITAKLDASQMAWTGMAKRWGELTGQDSRINPALAGVASEVRAAISATACNPTGWAAPDQIAGRIDLKRAVKGLNLSMVNARDVAHLMREAAATNPALTAPARVIAMRAQGETEIAIEQGISAYDGKTWATPRQIATNQAIPLPEPARRGLINLANEVIPTSNQTVTAAAPLDPSESAQRKRSGPPQALRRSGQSRTMRPHEPASKGPPR